MSDDLQKVYCSNQLVREIDIGLRKKWPNPITRATKANELITKIQIPHDNYYDPSLVRGALGELTTSYILEVVQYARKVMVKNGLIIRTADNRTTQLDHLILGANCGICLEVKTLYGNIVIDDDVIYQLTPQRTLEHKAWRQNFHHIYTLKEQLGGEDIYFYNVILLLGNCNVHVKSIRKGNQLLGYRGSVKNLITLIDSKPRTPPKEDKLKKFIANVNRLPRESEIEHIQSVQNDKSKGDSLWRRLINL